MIISLRKENKKLYWCLKPGFLADLLPTVQAVAVLRTDLVKLLAGSQRKKSTPWLYLGFIKGISGCRTLEAELKP